MVIQHNMMAMNANRVFNVNNSQQGKSTEKLSSGYKINRAGDDAAGLSISEKMRRQMRGLDRASINAQDGVSSVQTVEGALNEVHDILQRMNELATQASNGTNSQSDREAIQSEIDQLTTEIDRVSETTKFNETTLLKGSNGTKETILPAHDAGLDGTLIDNGDKTASFSTQFQPGSQVKIGQETYNIIEDDGKVSTNAAEIADRVDDLDVQDKVFVEDGLKHTAYQVTNDFVSLLNPAETLFNNNKNIFDTTQNGSFFPLTDSGLSVDGNKIGITYTDKDGFERLYEMQYVGAPDDSWQMIAGYNPKTGEAQPTGKSLFSGGNSGDPVDDELKDVLRTATKLVATQKRTGSTVTFGTTDEIKKDLANAPVGSKIFMTSVPGKGTEYDASIKRVYQHAHATPGAKIESSPNDDSFLAEPLTVRETSDVRIGDNNTITVHDAKKLVTRELKAANEIGVDDKSLVTAGFKKTGSDIASALNIYGGDTVTLSVPDKEDNPISTEYRIENSLAVDQNGSLFEGIVNAGVATDYTIIDITHEDGSTTRVKYDSATPGWLRYDDDTKISPESEKELFKDAIAVDTTLDTRAPEVAPNTDHERTPEGMRRDIAKLNKGDIVSVKSDNYGHTPGDTVNSGNITVENDPDGHYDFDLRLGSTETPQALSFGLHTGAETDMANKIIVDVEAMNAKFLGIKGLDVVGKDENGVNTDDGGRAATFAIDALQDAIEKINVQRSALGAAQNRLEHTMKNLDNVVENTTAAESRIRDTDIAEEMVNYSKIGILTQAGQSMIAQANQSAQSVTSLLG